MYMRNKNNNYYDRYSKYNINDFPPNYSGQYTKESLREDNPEICEADEKVELNKKENHEHHQEHDNHREHKEHNDHNEKESEESNEKHNNSLFGNLFGGNKHKDGKKGGLLSGFFNKGGDKDKDGGFLSHIELEDLILIAVIFFLLKDGFEDDLILILAIILFAS